MDTSNLNTENVFGKNAYSPNPNLPMVVLMATSIIGDKFENHVCKIKDIIHGR